MNGPSDRPASVSVAPCSAWATWMWVAPSTDAAANATTQATAHRRVRVESRSFRATGSSVRRGVRPQRRYSNSTSGICQNDPVR